MENIVSTGKIAAAAAEKNGKDEHFCVCDCNWPQNFKICIYIETKAQTQT